MTFDSPENVEGYRWVESFPERFGAEELQRFQSGVGKNFDSPQNPFFTGKIAMVMQGVWMANFIAQHAPDLEWGAAAFPTAVPGLYDAAIADCDSICIPSGARHPEEAFEFMQFLCSQEGSELLNMGQRKFTPLKKVSPEFIENHPNPYIRVFVELAASPNTFCTPPVSIWFECQDELQAVFDTIIFGLGRPEPALHEAQARVSAMWARERTRRDRRNAVEQEGAS